jgi:hypothetical protein
MDSAERAGQASVGGGGKFSSDVCVLLDTVRQQNLDSWGAVAPTPPLSTIRSISSLFSGPPAPVPSQTIGERIAETGFYGPMTRIIEQHVANGGCTQSAGRAALSALARLKSAAHRNGTVSFVAIKHALCVQAQLGVLRIVWTGLVPLLMLRSADSKSDLPIELRVILPCDASVYGGPLTRGDSVNRMSFCQNGVFPDENGIGPHHAVLQCEDYRVTAPKVAASPFARAAPAAAAPPAVPAAPNQPGPPNVAHEHEHFDVAFVAVVDTRDDRTVELGSIRRLVKLPRFLDAVALLTGNIARVQHDPNGKVRSGQVYYSAKV